MRKIIILLALLCLAVTSCNLPLSNANVQIVSRDPKYLVTANPNLPPTPTPFQPVAPTATSSIADVITNNDNPEIQEPTAVPKPVRPEGQINILVLGSDWRPNAGFRTDVMMLVSFYPNEGTASVVSFPRDLYVTLPGWGSQRINTAQAYGGFPLTVATFEENFDVTPDHYIMTNFQGFIGIINSVGGIDVNASKYLSDHCELPWGGVEKICSVYPGVTHMDGDTALWYVRSRYTTSDFDRTRRAQEVIQALFSKLMSLDAVKRAPELFQLYQSSVETDLTLNDILPLVSMAPTLLSQPEKVRRYAIGTDQVTSTVLPVSGAQVLLPNYDAIWQIIEEACYTP